MCTARGRAVDGVLAQQVAVSSGWRVTDHQLRRGNRHLADLGRRQPRVPASASKMRTLTSGSGIPTDPSLFGPFTGFTQSAIIASVSE